MDSGTQMPIELFFSNRFSMLPTAVYADISRQVVYVISMVDVRGANRLTQNEKE